MTGPSAAKERPRADFAVRRIGLLATMAGPVPRIGRSMRDLGLLEDAALAAAGGRIVWVGPDDGLPESVRLESDATVLDAGGAAVVPGFVDSHTHLAFTGDRDEEIRQRLAGATYQEIAAAGGGIVRTVEATRGATLEGLEEAIASRLDEMLLSGTTTAEVKSGYGLETAAEQRSLEAIRRAASRHPVSVASTFLGAHEVPREHRADRRRYVDLLLEEMIPAVAARGLAEFCDVFCEEGVFSIVESRRILLAARRHGMKLRLHADELANTGGGVATLLPTAAFYLRLGRFAPARALIDAGVPVALASDVNPGGGLSPSLPFAMALASFGMGMSLEEALTAVTINAAFSLDRHAAVGSLEIGKRADLLLLRAARLLDLVRVGVPAIQAVVKDGRVVARDGRRTGA